MKLAAKGQEFQYWKTHAEVGNSEHGHGEEGEIALKERDELKDPKIYER